MNLDTLKMIRERAKTYLYNQADDPEEYDDDDTGPELIYSFNIADIVGASIYFNQPAPFWVDNYDPVVNGLPDCREPEFDREAMGIDFDTVDDHHLVDWRSFFVRADDDGRQLDQWIDDCSFVITRYAAQIIRAEVGYSQDIYTITE